MPVLFKLMTAHDNHMWDVVCSKFALLPAKGWCGRWWLQLDGFTPFGHLSNGYFQKWVVSGGCTCWTIGISRFEDIVPRTSADGVRAMDIWNYVTSSASARSPCADLINLEWDIGRQMFNLKKGNAFGKTQTLAFPSHGALFVVQFHKNKAGDAHSHPMQSRIGKNDQLLSLK